MELTVYKRSRYLGNTHIDTHTHTSYETIVMNTMKERGSIKRTDFIRVVSPRVSLKK